MILDQINSWPNCWNPENPVVDSLAETDSLIEYWTAMGNEYENELKKQLGSQLEYVKDIAKTYADLGGTVVTGTDTPGGLWTFPGMALHRELELFVEIGFTEMEALQAATIKAADSIQLYDIGAIKKGKRADMVVLNKNPLENIQHTKDIDKIIKGGRIYTQEELLKKIPSQAYLDKIYHTFLEEFDASMGE